MSGDDEPSVLPGKSKADENRRCRTLFPPIASPGDKLLGG